MTAIEKTAAIRDLLSANLPALLGTASLDNFDEYLNKSPLRADDLEIAVYIDLDDNDVNTKMFQVIIQAQIHGKDEVQEYHSVIMPFLEEFLIGSVVDMTQRMHIKSDVYPLDVNSSTSFIFYEVRFETELDDCDF